MAAFSTSNFAYNSYATARPDYPSSLYDLILTYHAGSRDSLLDLGCGHGTVTRALAPHFKYATGADPSEGMLKEARQLSSPDINFIQGAAESLPSIPDESVDLVVAGQAAHWFPYPPEVPNVWTEMSRIVKPSGTVAFWGYADILFPNSSNASAVMHEWAYTQGEVSPGRQGMGSHWALPGRARIEGLYGGLVVPGDGWGDVKWVRKDERRSLDWWRDVEDVSGGVIDRGWEKEVTDKERELVSMQRIMTVGQVKAFARTWSAYHNWTEANKDHQSREKGEAGDVIDWAFDEIAEKESIWNDEKAEVLVEWPMGLLLVRRTR